MAFISMSVKYDLLYTPISNAFIDFYVPTTNPTFSIIYIYAFRNCFNGNSELEMKDIASVLNILESDVLNAWKYFESLNLVTINTDENNNFSIEFLPVPQKIEKKETKPIEESDQTKGVLLKTKPNYSIQEIEIYKSQSEEIAHLFKSFENALGKLLSYNDLNVIFSFYDWLRLPLDVIETLLEYCTTNGHRSMSYIESVAIDWFDKNINTVDKANSYVQRFNNDYLKILKAFGQAYRLPVEHEIQFMDTWLDTYNMPLEVILVACTKSMKNTGKPTFDYTNTIITKWHLANVKTLDAVALYDVEFKSNQLETKKVSTEKRTTQTVKKPKFANYKGRTWDYKEIEKLEQQYIKNKLKGN